MTRSLAERFCDLPPDDRDLLADLLQLTQEEAARLVSDWRFRARPEQRLPELDYQVVAWVTGRGAGKTRSASSNYHERIQRLARLPRARRGAGQGGLVHRTASEIREVMIDGEDGLLATAPRRFVPKYEPSKRRLTWPSGFTATCYSAEEPDQLRGPTLSLMWGEEFATWRGERGKDGATAYDNLRLCMRGKAGGLPPLTLLTTTPKRTAAMRELITRSKTPNSGVLVVPGQMYDNLRNLPPSFIDDIRTRYGDTALGQQEILGLLAQDAEGSVFKSQWFDETRITEEDLPSLGSIIVAVDPSVGDGSKDECGISVVGISDGPLADGKPHVFILDDATISGPPDVWAKEVADVAAYWNTTTVVVEANQGGQMARTILKNIYPALRVKEVHARQSKAGRAEPVAALFAQGRAHIVDELPDLTDQCTTWTPGDRDSPDRMDSMVHGVWHFMDRLQRRTTNSSAPDMSNWSTRLA